MPVPQSGESPSAAIARVEAACERLATPCDIGSMVWRRWGSGPPLVLLHGGYGSWRHWIRTIPAFASSRTLLVPDLPGLGDSGDVGDPVTPERIAATVVEGLGRLIPAGTPFDLAGFSFGALIGGHVAALLGSKLRSLTLVGAGALGLPRGDVKLVKWRSGMSADEIRAIHHTNLSRLMIANVAKIDDLAVMIQQQNTLQARVKSRKLAVTDSLAQALRRSAPKSLHAIWGECDSVVGGHIAEREAFLRSLRPDFQFRLIPGAGHWVAYEEPEQFNLVLGQLLESAADRP
jgi:pimeloyl-ACP methyl ester carboxylesterase